MQATRVKSGQTFDYTPGDDVAAGDIIVQGDLVAVATADIANGKPGTLDAGGIYDLDKAGATVFTAGALVYWDDTNNLAVTTNGGGANKLVGKAVAAAGSGPVVVRTLFTP